MKKRILIFGDGQIGNFYLDYFTAKRISSMISVADITSAIQISSAIEVFKPTIIINAAGKTSLEWCEQNREDAFDANVLGAGNLARAASEHGIYFIHLSSGCIFSSNRAEDVKSEPDVPNPASYYALTKVWSEQLVSFENKNCLILRPRQPVSTELNSKNMLVKMLTFSKFVDTPNSGTVLEDLMAWTDQLIDKQATGIYHVANTGYSTPYKIAKLLREYILPDLKPELISKAELDKLTPNKRVDTVLSVAKLQSLGIEVEPYDKRLIDIIQQLARNIKATDKAKLKAILEATALASKQRTKLNNVYRGLYK